MNGKYLLHLLLLPALLITAGVSDAQNSAQSANLEIDPVIRLLPAVNSGQDSAAELFTITNKNTLQTRTLGVLSLSGVNADQFGLVSDACTNAVLAANGGSCTVSVKLHPTSSGKKSANLLVPSDDAETPTLTAFVANYEATKDQAQRRMPPVLATVTIPESMQAGILYTLTWTEEGYNDNYTTNIVLFDCTGISDGSCGANYTDTTKFAESGNLSPVSSAAGNWQFSGVSTQLFNYSWDFTVPAKRSDGSAWTGNTIVVRFYSKNDIDAARGNPSISLLIPGNLTNTYYDTAGRRIVKELVP